MTTDFFILATKTSAFAILLRRWATQNRATARQAPALREFNRGLHGKISHEFTRICTNYLLTADCMDYAENFATNQASLKLRPDRKVQKISHEYLWYKITGIDTCFLDTDTYGIN